MSVTLSLAVRSARMASAKHSLTRYSWGVVAVAFRCSLSALGRPAHPARVQRARPGPGGTESRYPRPRHGVRWPSEHAPCGLAARADREQPDQGFPREGRLALQVAAVPHRVRQDRRAHRRQHVGGGIGGMIARGVGGMMGTAGVVALEDLSLGAQFVARGTGLVADTAISATGPHRGAGRGRTPARVQGARVRSPVPDRQLAWLQHSNSSRRSYARRSIDSIGYGPSRECVGR
jgi:hypothetical protein